jgi:hypothetical protein
LAVAYFELGGSQAGEVKSGRPGSDVSIYRRNRELESDYFKPVASAVSGVAIIAFSAYIFSISSHVKGIML